jgi:hypothetical protein
VSSFADTPVCPTNQAAHQGPPPPVPNRPASPPPPPPPPPPPRCTKCQEARWVESPEGDMVRQLAYGQTKRGTCKRCLFEFGDYCVACSGDTPWKCTK